MSIWSHLNRGRAFLLPLAAIVMAGAIACSSDDDPTPTATSSAGTAEPEATATAVNEAATATPEAAAGAALEVLVEDSDLGPYLTDADGFALYVFTRDAPDTSNCAEDCLQTWPPLLLENGATVEAGAGATGTFGSIETAAGTQVTYNSAPLYYFAADAAAGDTNGHLVGNVWFLARPDTASTAVVGASADGAYLVGPTGLTLYLFANDSEGVSNCSGGCLENWPALTVPENLDPTAVDAAGGALDVITRDDGALQVTYNGLPLYYFAADAVPGDTNGDGVGGVWSLATP